MDKILIIEDDLKLQKYIQEYLLAYHFAVETVTDFSRIVEQTEPNSSSLCSSALCSWRLPVWGLGCTISSCCSAAPMGLPDRLAGRPS